MVIKDEELNTIYGGGINIGIWLSIGSLITLVIGIIDGYTRPLKCNK